MFSSTSIRSNKRRESPRESPRSTDVDRRESDMGDAGLSVKQPLVEGRSIELRASREAGTGPDWKTCIVDVGECNVELTFNTWLGTQVEWTGEMGDVAGPWVQAWIPPEAGGRPLEFGRRQPARMALPRQQATLLTAGWADPDVLEEVRCKLSKHRVFIEMGQGLIAQQLNVLSSTLYSCLFIAGRNSRTGLAGAYHYPAQCLHDPTVWGDLLAWQAALHPDEVVVLNPSTQTEAWKQALASSRELAAIATWAERGGASVRIEPVSRPFMSNADGKLEAGDADRNGLGDAHVSLVSRSAGDHVDAKEALMRLIGRDRTRG